MKTLTLTLPLPPSVNSQYVNVGKRRVLSKSAKAFRRSVEATIRDHFDNGYISDRWLEEVRGQNIATDIVYYFETPFRRDLDGGLKITLDAVCDALQFDDRHIVSITLEKRIDPLNPRAELELGMIADWEFDQSYVVIDQDLPTKCDG